MKEKETLSDEKLIHECRKRANRLRGDTEIIKELIDRFEALTREDPQVSSLKENCGGPS